MNTSKERILETLENSPDGLCDDCLSLQANVLPRQQVNTIARILFSAGTIKRERGKCPGCEKTKYLNALTPLFPMSALEDASETIETTPEPIDPAEKLDSMRRGIIGFLNKLDPTRSNDAESRGRETVSEKIHRLFEANIIPPNIHILIRTLNAFRNLSVYDGYVVSPKEIKIINETWAVVVDWARTVRNENR